MISIFLWRTEGCYHAASIAPPFLVFLTVVFLLPAEQSFNLMPQVLRKKIQKFFVTVNKKFFLHLSSLVTCFIMGEYKIKRDGKLSQQLVCNFLFIKCKIYTL